MPLRYKSSSCPLSFQKMSKCSNFKHLNKYWGEDFRIRTLSAFNIEVWVKSELVSKLTQVFFRSEFKKNSIEFILHLRIGTFWAAIILHICEEDIRNRKMTLLFLSSLGQVWLTYFQNCFKSECHLVS